MLELLKYFLDKLDILAVADALRKRRNRRLAAQLHAILVQSYEIIEIYRVLLDELQQALVTREATDGGNRFYVNPGRIASLLKRQSSNLEVMETLTYDLFDELRILDNDFAEAYRDLFPGKFGLFFEVQGLLGEGRLPTTELGFDELIDDRLKPRHSLWFTFDRPVGDRRTIEQDLYLGAGASMQVVDVNYHDGEAFYQELARYLAEEKPLERLRDLERLTERYRSVLLERFTIEDLLSDIQKVKRHRSWTE